MGCLGHFGCFSVKFDAEKRGLRTAARAGFSLGEFACAFFHKPLTFVAVTGTGGPLKDDRASFDEKDVARRRDELLARARGEAPSVGGGGQRPRQHEWGCAGPGGSRGERGQGCAVGGQAKGWRNIKNRMSRRSTQN